jgi:transcription elongation GreA/GreB family factor
MVTKEIIVEKCKLVILHRISNAEYAMNAAQEGAISEDKSSAGDKYETSRAMGQIDRNMNAKQLLQAQQELTELSKITIQQSSVVKQGTFIRTEQTKYFIAVGLGSLQIENETVIILSPKSPLAIALMGKKAGDNLVFNQKSTRILEVS